MKAQQLKNAILQLAISGKLVPQDPNDEPASELLCKIQAEKDRLIAESKIKKSKKSADKAPYSKIEPPFDIPESWVWVRLGDLIFNLGQKAPKEKFCYIDVGSIDNKKHKLADIENIIEAKDAPSRARKLIQNGTILYSTVRPYLQNICIIDTYFKYEPIASTAFAVMNVFSDFYNKYLFYYLLSPTFTEFVSQEMVGVAYPAINDEKLYKFIVPVPPLNEQHRIVAKIEELLPFIEQYDQKERQLTALNKNFPEQLKKSILQAAIQGKLTEQLPTDEPASELLKRIQAEKARLISEKKVKKPKHSSEIIVRDNLAYEIKDGVERCIADEIPFDIPESWCWVRLGDIGEWGSGATPNRHEPKFYENGTIPWLKTGDLNDNYIDEIPEYITTLAVEKTSVKLNPIGSVLIAMYGATIGKLGILNIEATTNQACCACVPDNGIFNKYLFYYLMSQKSEFQKRSEGSGQPNISKEKIVSYLFPLPPLEEQYRIVAKIEQLLSNLQKLE
ncbi:restriction endonuclease subunit S [Actinobacillus porcinus]|uniref:restriction endonuclease subunit S n=1 Tax=Actinobacillus porcinus TaxID=51048 RepID=UPI0023F15CE9|nr:restriction endonuclease subunit S [Actinobacillus porcinus]MDD7545343.1 restriction endonuclease subunit S [Actinobacillus porcinus]MDY5848801.1 restriction endonuclease subunit S [Actinobacillus porcinus]